MTNASFENAEDCPMLRRIWLILWKFSTTF